MPFPSSLTRLSAIARGSAPAAWARSLPMWVSVGLVLLIAWQAVQLAWTLLGTRRAPAPAPSAATSNAPPVSPPVDVGAIVNAHLFGVAGAPAAGETDPASVAATQMNLVLVGTIASAIPEQGYAIVGESAQSARVYSVGKTIAGGAKLHSVYPDRVILDRGGKLEALMLPKKFQGGGLAAGTPPPPQTDAMLGERLRDLATQNPGAITEIIRPQPVFANGQPRGLRVLPGRSRQQFS
jgi:general secretion pathway protein C